MDSAKKFMYRTMKNSIFIFLFELLLIVLLSASPMKYVYGLILGYLMNLVFFRIMYLNAKTKVEMAKKRAIAFTRLNYMARMSLTALVFYLAAVTPKVSLLTCFIGMLNVKLAIYLGAIFDSLMSKRTKRQLEEDTNEYQH